MSQATDDLGNVKVPLSDGSALFALPYDPGKAAESIKADIGQKTDTAIYATPDPTTDDEGRTVDPHAEGGPLRRFTDIKSPLGMVGLESLAKDEDEIAKAITARADEIYRNEFPVIVPKFARRCLECGAEFEDEEIDECPECGNDELDSPDPEERRDIKELFEHVNREGQSMRQVGKITDQDHSRLGVLCWVLRWTYLTGPREVGGPLSDASTVIDVRFEELLRGDPKRIVPVVDEDGRVGGVWWTCPLHRSEQVVSRAEFEAGQQTCPACGCDLREVHYVELEGAAGRDLEKFFFEHEIVMYAGHFPQSNGLDGLSPVHLVWLEQAILHWMDVYAAEYFNPHSERTPNKFLIIHTANPDSFERQLDDAKEDAQANPYKSGIFYNRIDPGQQANTEAQVVDVMGDQFLGQSEDLRKRFENHIRTVFGVTDVFDSELEDAGGLNNEGLQLEVTDRSIAAAQQDYSDGPYDELLRYLGYEDWRIKFVPPREQDLQEQRNAVALLREAAEIGLPARMENGEPVIGDGEAEAPAQPDTDGFGDDPGPPDVDLPPPGEDGETGNATPDDARAEGLRALENGFKHVVWDDGTTDVGQKAREPFFADRDDVPEFVQEALRAAVRGGAITTISEKLPADVTRGDITDFFEAQLAQPQGWSLRSLTENYAEQFGVDEADARTAVRTQVSGLLNTSRELGYEAAPEGDEERVFKWIGPEDADNTDACRELRQLTNPDFGGTPRPLDELKGLVAEVRTDHFPDFDGSDWTVHWNERHTFVEHFE